MNEAALLEIKKKYAKNELLNCIFGILGVLCFIIAIFSAIAYLDYPKPFLFFQLCPTAFFLGLICFAISRFFGGRYKELENQVKEFVCHYCRSWNPIIAPYIPFCQACLDKEVKEIQALIKETTEKIAIAENLELASQANGSRLLFEKNLPPIIRWVLNQTILAGLKEYFPQASIFSSRGFEKHILDTADPGVNIPLEGLRLLKEVREKGLQLTT